MFKKTLLHQVMTEITFAVQGRDRQPRPEPIDIEKEYELIRQRKSTLSANKRRWVVARYEEKHHQG